MLLGNDKKHGHFVRDNFKGVFFTPAILDEIDSIRFNCDKLKGYRRDIALASLGRSVHYCQPFGKFSFRTKNLKNQDSVKKRHALLFSPRGREMFKEKYRENLEYYNSLVFNNKRANKAYNKDIRKLAPTIDADLAYYDPPYVTEFSNTNYEEDMHFIEGLMTNWKDKEINKDSKVRKYKDVGADTKLTKATVPEFFDEWLDAADVDYVMLSYRDKSYPRPGEIKEILEEDEDPDKRFDIIKDVKIEHKYQISAKHGDASNAVEHIYIAERVD